MIRVESAIIAIFAVLVGLLLGVVGGFFGRMLISRRAGWRSQLGSGKDT